MRRIREFFFNKGYLEVETPLLAPFRIPEAHIDLFITEFMSPGRTEMPLCLLPSPELWMKRLLSEGFPSCFQITKSFRNNEQVGKHHNPEFSILEWYTLGIGYMESAAITEELIDTLRNIGPGLKREDRSVALSVQDAVKNATGVDILKCTTSEELRSAAAAKGYRIEGETWEEIFHKLFLLYVEPGFAEIPVLFLHDYPRQIPCLAREHETLPTRERWELYIRGIEIANCFTEETRRERVRSFMEGEAAEADPGINIDTALPSISAHVPASSGVALGIDRLLMALTGTRDIREVLLFPFSDFPRSG